MFTGFNSRTLMLICFLSSVSGCSWFTDQEDGPSKEAAANTYAKLGTEYLRMGQMNVALEKLRLALELDDNNIEAHDSIAVLYEQIKEYPKAQQHFEAALSLQPERAATLNNYGRFLCDRGEYEEAFEHLQKAMAMPLNDNKWYAFTNAGRCELMRGDQNKAEQYFRQALEYQANYAPALLELQRISYRNGNYLSAKAFLQRYLEVAEHTPGTLWVGIQTELALGNRELAFQYRRLLLEKFANSNEAKQIQATLPSSSTNPSNN